MLLYLIEDQMLTFTQALWKKKNFLAKIVTNIGLILHQALQFFLDTLYLMWRYGGLMVSALDSRLSGLGSSPGWITVLCSWARHFTLMVPLFTQVYK